jgi:diaminopimelate epimerase
MIKFWKYDATGNDFLVFEGINQQVIEMAPKLCARRTGVGADGILFIKESSEYDFELFIVNSDGSIPKMCANGARASIHWFQNYKKSANNSKGFNFLTPAGPYKGSITGNFVSLKLDLGINPITSKEMQPFSYSFPSAQFYVNSGVPHCLVKVKEDFDLLNFNLEKEALPLRHNAQFSEGVNVSFFQKQNESYFIRTFERGVEGETLSCGTAVMALSQVLDMELGESPRGLSILTKGGNLNLGLAKNILSYEGNVSMVFEGMITEKIDN